MKQAGSRPIVCVAEWSHRVESVFQVMARNLRQVTLGFLIFAMLTGCLPIPPRSIPISDAPATSGPSCSFTIVRDRHILLALNTHYISLDGTYIASLDMSEYTTFSVPEGRHLIGVTWRVIDEDSIRYRVMGWRDLSKSVDVDCEPPMSFLYTTTEGFPWYPDETVVIERVDQFEGEFALETKEFVPPGARPSN